MHGTVGVEDVDMEGGKGVDECRGVVHDVVDIAEEGLDGGVGGFAILGENVAGDRDVASVGEADGGIGKDMLGEGIRVDHVVAGKVVADKGIHIGLHVGLRGDVVLIEDVV